MTMVTAVMMAVVMMSKPGFHGGQLSHMLSLRLIGEVKPVCSPRDELEGLC